MKNKLFQLGKLAGKIEMVSSTNFMKTLIMSFPQRFFKTQKEFIKAYNMIIEKSAQLEIDTRSSIISLEELNNYKYEKNLVEFEFFAGYNEFHLINNRKRIGALIKARRTELGYSQSELAKMSGLKQPNINRIEKGNYSTGLDLISKIFTALGLSVEAIKWF